MSTANDSRRVQIYVQRQEDGAAYEFRGWAVPSDAIGSLYIEHMRDFINSILKRDNERLHSRAPLYEAAFDPTTGVAGE